MKTRITLTYPNELYHHGVRGVKWGVRRYQNADGSLTDKGKKKLESYKEREIAKIDKKSSRIKAIDQKKVSRSLDKLNKQAAKNSQKSASGKKLSYRDAKKYFKYKEKSEILATKAAVNEIKIDRERSAVMKMTLSDVKKERAYKAGVYAVAGYASMNIQTSNRRIGKESIRKLNKTYSNRVKTIKNQTEQEKKRYKEYFKNRK